MIIFYSRGGLGNELFQLNWILNNHGGHKIILINFKYISLVELEKNLNFLVIKNNLLCRLLRTKFAQNILFFNNIFSRLQDSKDGNTYLGGYKLNYFLSKKIITGYDVYFQYYKPILINIKSSSLIQSSKASNSDSLIVHIRGGDYLQHFWNNESIVLSQAFYKKAIDLMLEIRDRDFDSIRIITNDYRYAKSILPQGYAYTYENNDELNDFSALYYSKNLIISNSSFAYWAMYLNLEHKDLVVAPKYWFGQNSAKKSHSKLFSEKFLEIDEFSVFK